MLLVEKLQETVDEINSKLKGSYLNKIECLNEYDYIFRFSYSKENSIFISLNVKNPFVTLLKKKYNFASSSTFYQRIKNKLLNACLLGASILNDDNILMLEFLKTTDTYDRIRYFLIFEIFKSNANLILVTDDKINEAFRYKGIDTHHPIMRNMTYTPPMKVSYSKEVQEKDEKAENEYINNIEKTFLKNKYKSVQVDIKRRLKSLTKKIDKIQADQEEAIEKLEYKNYGDYYLTIMHEVKRGDQFFDYYGKKIKINETYSPTENLNYLYKTYKKAKLTIESTKDYIHKTQDEISYLKSIIASFDYLNDEDYQELIQELVNKKIIKFKGPKKLKNVKNASKPYFISYQGVRIGFGKNSKQNATLTFSYAKKDDYFLHIKNNHGNHVIIFDSDPSDDVIEFALEFCVYLAKLTDAEVIYAKVKTLRKGNEEGLVKLGAYESYQIKTLHHDFQKYLDSSCRF